jgi:hypothetical protein
MLVYGKRKFSAFKAGINRRSSAFLKKKYVQA